MSLILIVEANAATAAHLEEKHLSRYPKNKVLRVATKEEALVMISSNEDITHVVVTSILRDRTEALTALNGDQRQHQ